MFKLNAIRSKINTSKLFGIYLLILSSSLIAVELSIVNLDELNRSFDIVYTSSEDLYGFELDIEGVNIQSYDHNLSGEVYVNDNHVLGLSFNQDALLPAAVGGELISITYEFSLENTSICLSNGVFAGVPDVPYNAAETCNDLNWSGIGIDFGSFN